MKVDYYETLGVERTCDDKELKAAFRRLAMQFHPDKNPGDAASEKKFKEIGEAYEALYGLVVRDWHVRMLLGEDMSERARSFGPRAKKAVSAFLRLYGTNKGMAG